jgi:hypothetical protein
MVQDAIYVFEEENMIVRSTLLAIVLFIGFLGVAAAQTKPPADSATLGTGKAAASDTAVTAVATGWYYTHAAACTAVAGGAFVLIGTDNSQWFVTDLGAIATLTPACQTGHFVAFFVVNTNGAFNQVFVWPF